VGFKWSAAHNSFVQIGAELGVLGLGLFVALFAVAVRALSRVGRGQGAAAFLAQTLTASLVAYVVSGFFLSAAYWAYLYTLLGMVAGLVKIAGPARATGAVRLRPARNVGIGWGGRRGV
jgi:O-antigen ligase